MKTEGQERESGSIEKKEKMDLGAMGTVNKWEQRVI